MHGSRHEQGTRATQPGARVLSPQAEAEAAVPAVEAPVRPIPAIGLRAQSQRLSHVRCAQAKAKKEKKKDKKEKKAKKAKTDDAPAAAPAAAAMSLHGAAPEAEDAKVTVVNSDGMDVTDSAPMLTWFSDAPQGCCCQQANSYFQLRPLQSCRRICNVCMALLIPLNQLPYMI